MARRGALQVLAERSGSDSDECMFDQTNLLQRRRLDITRFRRTSSTMSGHRLTVARTVNLCLAFFALGLCFAMPTATVTGLQYRTSSSESAIGNIYRARYGGYIVGCFAGGFLFNCYNRQFLLFLALLATAIGVFVMPFCRALAVLMTCTCVTGVTMGLLDTGGNVWLLDLWGRKSAPFMQTMHFCFGLGALVAPLVAQPFIGAYDQIGLSTQAFNGSHAILLPISIRSPHNPYAGRLRRAVDNGTSHAGESSQLSASTIAKILASSTIAPSSTTSNASTPATVAPKKPHITDQLKEEDRWDRKPAVHPVHANGTAAVTASGGKNVTGSSPEKSHSTTAKPASVASHVKPAKAPAVPHEPKESPSKDGGGGSSSGDEHSKAAMPAPKHGSPSTTTTRPASAKPTPPASTVPTVQEHPHEVKALKVVGGAHPQAAPTESHEESTTKKTASTVPTEGTVPAATSATSTSSPKKQHSIKKVLPDEAPAVDASSSWLDAARKKIQESGKFEIAYGILAAYVLVVSVVFLVFLCMNPREGRSKQEDEVDDSTGRGPGSGVRICLIVLMCSFFCLYMGIEVAVEETLKSLFERADLLNRVVSGEHLVYIFWGSFAFARGVSIFVSVKVSYRAMLALDIVICLVAALTLVFGAQQSSGLVIAGLVLLAIGMASIIPTLFIWLERCTQVTNRLSALLILCAAAGEMMIPEIVSAFTRRTPMALMYVILCVILLCSVNLAALCYVTSIRGEKYVTKPDRSLYQLASLDDDIEHWAQGRRKNDSLRDDEVVVKRNKNNSFFYNRLNILDS